MRCTNTGFHRLWWAAKETRLMPQKSITIFMKLEQVAAEFTTNPFCSVTQALVMKVKSLQCSSCPVWFVSHEGSFHRLICNAAVFVWCDVCPRLLLLHWTICGPLKKGNIIPPLQLKVIQLCSGSNWFSIHIDSWDLFIYSSASVAPIFPPKKKSP